MKPITENMIEPYSKKELFETMRHSLDRHTPQIVTEVNNPENLPLFEKALRTLPTYVMFQKIKSPKMLFELLMKHQNDLVIFRDDVFAMSKDYLEMVEAAVCSSPDSLTLWPVEYLNEKSFTFKGAIILCTNKTYDEIHEDKEFEYFARDCRFI